MGLQLVTGPTVEPVTLDEAKLNLRQIDDSEDTLIELLISSAREYAEHKTGRALNTQTWRLVLDAFPAGPITLERGPVQSISSIRYLSSAGTWTTVTAPDEPGYALDASLPYARFAPGVNQSWPSTSAQIGAVEITYVTGYGDTAADVPKLFKNWILARVNTAYEQREESALNGRMTLAPVPYLDRLLEAVTSRRAVS